MSSLKKAKKAKALKALRQKQEENIENNVEVVVRDFDVAVFRPAKFVDIILNKELEEMLSREVAQRLGLENNTGGKLIKQRERNVEISKILDDAIGEQLGAQSSSIDFNDYPIQKDKPSEGEVKSSKKSYIRIEIKDGVSKVRETGLTRSRYLLLKEAERKSVCFGGIRQITHKVLHDYLSERHGFNKTVRMARPSRSKTDDLANDVLFRMIGLIKMVGFDTKEIKENLNLLSSRSKKRAYSELRVLEKMSKISKDLGTFELKIEDKNILGSYTTKQVSYLSIDSSRKLIHFKIADNIITKSFSDFLKFHPDKELEESKK